MWGGEAVDEHAVVADDHGAAGEFFQRLFQSRESFGVEVFGGLVEEVLQEAWLHLPTGLATVSQPVTADRNSSSSGSNRSGRSRLGRCAVPSMIVAKAFGRSSLSPSWRVRI